MTKVDIYSGFLGAGKTTLIKKMISEGYKGQKLVLIENEFGEIGIDGGFLQDAGINITEMNSGCICCSLVGDFGRALKKVIAEYSPDRVIIEPSGVGKLSDVIGAVNKVTGDDVTLGYTVAVVDASKVKVYMKNFGEFYNNQIETASTIILSRTDSISQFKLDTAVSMLREHNQVASIVTTPWDQLTGEQLVAAMEGKASLAAELAKMEMERLEDEDDDCCCHHHHDDDDDDEEHEHHHHHHDEDEDDDEDLDFGSITTLEDLSWKTALGIGCFQVLSLIPGTSRSGSTIIGGLLLGCTRSVASKFTFFLAIPVMFGASALKLVKYFIKGGTFGTNEIAILGVGCVVAFVVSLIAIKWLMGFVRRHDFKCFGVYRIILGIVVLAYFFVLEPMLGL